MSNLGSLQQLQQRLHARAMEYTKEYFYFIDSVIALLFVIHLSCLEVMLFNIQIE